MEMEEFVVRHILGTRGKVREGARCLRKVLERRIAWGRGGGEGFGKGLEGWERTRGTVSGG
jgi:hypothetical protein